MSAEVLSHIKPFTSARKKNDEEELGYHYPLQGCIPNELKTPYKASLLGGSTTSQWHHVRELAFNTPVNTQDPKCSMDIVAALFTVAKKEE